MRVCFLLVCVVLLQACDLPYGVVRTVPAPLGFDPVAAETAARGHEHVDLKLCNPWNGEWLQVCVVEGAAHAELWFDGDQLEVSSIWLAPPPADDLRESVRLQSELIDLLRTVVPDVPASGDWRVHWVRMDPQPTVLDPPSIRAVE